MNAPIVFVLPEHGAETKGRLIAFDPDSLTLAIDGRRIVFQRDEILRIYRRGDTVRNGMGWGAMAGIVGSVGLMATIPTGGCDAFEGAGRFGCNALGKFFVWLVVAPVSMVVGMAAGVAIDSVIVGRTMIYERPVPAALRRGRRFGSVSLVPVITPQQSGLALSIRW